MQTVAARQSLSIVVVTFAGSVYLDRCLQALLLQINVDNVEIIVVCDQSFCDVSAWQNRFPQMRFIAARGHRTFAELRALGVANAQGTIIALTEDHCIPNPDWCERILQAHIRSYGAVGGAVEKAPPDTALNWALYLSDYARYMNSRSAGYSSELTDCNVSYKRSALDAIAGVWSLEFHEPAVHGALLAKGQSLWFSPDIIVYQRRSARFREAIRERYIFGRLFGSGRADAVTMPRRFFYGTISILLPALLVGRVARHVFRRQRHVGIFLRSLPALIVLNSVWACGEFVGYLTGRADTSLTPQARFANAKSRAGAIT